MAAKAPLFKTNFEFGDNFQLTNAFLNWRFFQPNLHIRHFQDGY